MRPKMLCLACLAAMVCLRPALAGTEMLSHAIFVKVNGKPITQDNVLEASKFIIKREYNDTAPHDEEELAKIQKAALRDLVRTILIHDQASAQGVKLDRNVSRQTVAASGLKQEEITPTIRRMLEADDLFLEIMGNEGTPIMPPTPKQLRDFYNKNREQFRTNQEIIIRTIFIANEGRFSQTYYKNKADGIMRDLLAIPIDQRTAAFELRAKKDSQDVFGQFGGLLTADSPNHWIPKMFDNRNAKGEPMFPQGMVDVIHSFSQPGDLKMAVTEEGMHILYCEDMRGGKVLSWEEASKICDYVIRTRVKNERMRAWLGRVYDRSDVRWHDGSVYEKKLLTEVLLPSEKAPDTQH